MKRFSSEKTVLISFTVVLMVLLFNLYTNYSVGKLVSAVVFTIGYLMVFISYQKSKLNKRK